MEMAAAYPSSTAGRDDQALARAFAADTIWSVTWLIYAPFIGTVLAYKFGAPDFGFEAWLTFRRVRPIQRKFAQPILSHSG
jgi:cytochrome c oxidase cbb3-type subunit 1